MSFSDGSPRGGRRRRPRASHDQPRAALLRGSHARARRRQRTVKPWRQRKTLSFL